jgi:hypothetical protein
VTRLIVILAVLAALLHAVPARAQGGPPFRTPYAVHRLGVQILLSDYGRRLWQATGGTDG